MTKNEFRQSILPMASETIALLARNLLKKKRKLQHLTNTKWTYLKTSVCALTDGQISCFAAKCWTKCASMTQSFLRMLYVLAVKSLSLLLFLIYLCGLTLDFIITDKRVSRNILGVMVVIILGIILHKIMNHG